MNQKVKMKNGSNNLGSVFSWSYVPKNVLLFYTNTNQTVTEPVRWNELLKMIYRQRFTKIFYLQL